MANKAESINDCWNRIGVWRKGNETCPSLASAIHCRNCSTFIKAGHDLHDRDLPDNYSNDNAHVYKTAKQDQDKDTTSCLIFSSGKEWYALETRALSEIGEFTEVHSIPHNRNSVVDGLVNIRGEMEICFSFTALSSDNNTLTDNRKSRLVIVNLDSGKYAFRADEVMGIFNISTRQIKHPPSSISRADTALTRGVFEYDDIHIGLIDESAMDHKLCEALT